MRPCIILIRGFIVLVYRMDKTGSSEGYAPPVSLFCLLDSGCQHVSPHGRMPHRFSHPRENLPLGLGKRERPYHLLHRIGPWRPSARGARADATVKAEGARRTSFVGMRDVNRAVQPTKAFAFANRQPTGASCRATPVRPRDCERNLCPVVLVGLWYDPTKVQFRL